METTQVCLINPPTRRTSLRPPLGLMYISAYLTSKGISNRVLDPKGEMPEDELAIETVQKAIACKPELIGISCLTTDLLCVFKMAAQIKSQLPAVKIVLGGIHPTLFPEQMLQNKDVDYVVIGEGEYTLFDLVTSLAGGESLSSVQGIAYKENGKVIINEKRPMIKDLNAIPLPAYDQVDMSFYLQPNIHLIRGIPMKGFYIFSTRGCPARCRFCVNKNIFGRTVRFRDPVKVADEVEFIYEKYGIDGFYMYDDTFGVRKSDVDQFCDELIRRKLPLVWGCATRINLITEDFVKKIKAAGCMQIDFGVESGSQRLLDLLQKDITLEQIRQAISICKKHKMRVFSNFMINLPTETEEDIDTLISFANELKSEISIFNITCPFPGTDIVSYQQTELTIEDYPKMSGMASFNTYIDLLEEKCKLSDHKIPIREILKRIQLSIPSPRDIRLKPSLNYIRNLMRYLNFITNLQYLGCLLRSRNKYEYLMFFGKMLRRQNISTTKK